MIVWLLARGIARRRAMLALVIVAADLIVGPLLLAWEWRALREYLP